jgi:ATP-binding cassette subfamily F protein 3
LDEPTNHLDLWAREALDKSLRTFAGTVLLVSHDRYFLNRVVDHLLVVEPGRFRVIEGNYDTYQHLAGRPTAAGDGQPAEPRKPADRDDAGRRIRRKQVPERRKRRFPYRKLEEIEAEIAEREARIEQLHSALADPQLLRDGSGVKRARAELDEQQTALIQLYEHWEETVEMNG